VGGDVNKIRTVMKTYGNAEVVSQLQKDFENINRMLYMTKNNKI
jgi:hypothetical protein